MYSIWAVISGREYCGEDFRSLKLFSNFDDAVNYSNELNEHMDSECYTIIDSVYVDYGVNPQGDMLGLPSNYEPQVEIKIHDTI